VLSGVRMWLGAVGCGVRAGVCFLLCFVIVEERVQTPAKAPEQRMGLVQPLKTLVTNRALTGLVLGALFMLIGQMLLPSLMAYTYDEYFNDAQLLSLVDFLALAPTLPQVPFAANLRR